MIDFNMWEITALVALAIIVFGPEKLPELARKAARVLNHLRRIGNDARGQLRKELGPEFDDIHLADLNPRNLAAKYLLSNEEIEDLRQIRDEALSSGQLVKDTMQDAADAASTKGASAARTGSTAPADPVDDDAGEVAGEARVRVPFDPEST